jgi:hypothetical protein
MTNQFLYRPHLLADEGVGVLTASPRRPVKANRGDLSSIEADCDHFAAVAWGYG